MIKSSVRSIRNKLRRYPFVREIISLLLLVGVIYFGVKGAMVLALQTTSPIMGVSQDSMTHPDESWRNCYENTSEFPFRGGLQPGDLVIIEGVDSPEDVNVGDVIIWEKGERRIIHRVAENGKDAKGLYFRTRSDKYKDLDPVKVRLDDIAGKATFSIPYLGYPSIWF